MTADDYHALPDKILIREFAVGGIVYVTTLLDDKKYHKKELAQLYKERGQLSWIFVVSKPTWEWKFCVANHLRW